ncbi:MAG: 50S ribosomal protein L18 [Kiritimatiellia bacterium]
MKARSRKDLRQRRHRRIRRRITGTAERPRMSVSITNAHMYVQFIDDLVERTLASASTAGSPGRNTVTNAEELGRRAAEAALKKGIDAIAVDRGGFKYHGRVKSIVESALSAGLKTGDEKEQKQNKKGSKRK